MWIAMKHGTLAVVQISGGAKLPEPVELSLG